MQQDQSQIVQPVAHRHVRAYEVGFLLFILSGIGIGILLVVKNNGLNDATSAPATTTSPGVTTTPDTGTTTPGPSTTTPGPTDTPIPSNPQDTTPPDAVVPLPDVTLPGPTWLYRNGTWVGIGILIVVAMLATAAFVALYRPGRRMAERMKYGNRRDGEAVDIKKKTKRQLKASIKRLGVEINALERSAEDAMDETKVDIEESIKAREEARRAHLIETRRREKSIKID